MESFVVGIDLGGTKIEACLMNENKEVLRRERIPTHEEKGIASIQNNILALIENIKREKEISAIGMGTPGTYLVEDESLYGAPQSPSFLTKGWIPEFEKKLKVPLLIENDANCFAVAEFFATQENSYSHVLGLILGTGVGGGLILNNKLYRGKNGAAGEIGHSSIKLDGRECACGKKGCLQTYLSGPSIENRYFELTRIQKTAIEIYSDYKKQEPLAMTILEESLEILGVALGNLITVFDLDAIIIGGGVSNMDLWYQKLGPFVYKNNFGIDRVEFPILQAKLGDSAGVIGAAYLALKKIGKLHF